MSGLRGLELGRTFGFQSQPFSWRGIESFVHPSKELSILQHSRTIVYRSEKNILISVNDVRSLSTSLLRFASASASASASARDEASADPMSSSSSSSARLTATGSTSAEALSSEPPSNHPADSSAARGGDNVSSSSASAISTPPPPPALPPRLSITGEQFLQAQGKIQELGEKLGKIKPLDHYSSSSSAEWSSASESSSSSSSSSSLPSIISSPSYISVVEKSLSSDLDRGTWMQRHGAKLGHGLILFAAVMLRIVIY